MEKADTYADVDIITQHKPPASCVTCGWTVSWTRHCPDIYGQLHFHGTDGNWIWLEVCWSDTYHKKHDIYASFQFLVGSFRWCRVKNILYICLSNSDFSLELHTRGWYRGRQDETLGPWWRVMVTVCPVLAPLLQQGTACWQGNDITRGALCPSFFFFWERWNFAHKGCTALLSPDLSGHSTFENP